MKNRVSANIRMFRFAAIAIIVVPVMLRIDGLMHGNTPLGHQVSASITLLIFAVIAYWVYRFLNNSKTVEFSQAWLYITDQTGTQTIPFNRIVSLKKNNMYVNDQYTWRITYRQEDGSETSVLFLPRSMQLHLDEFKRLVAGYGADVDLF